MEHTKWSLNKDKKHPWIVECETNVPRIKGEVAIVSYKPYASLIIRAVNSHEKLVEALKSVRKYLEERGIRERGIVGRTQILPQIDQALAEAEKE